MTVRAFRQQGAFEARNARLLDESNRAYWPAQVGDLTRPAVAAATDAWHAAGP